MSYTHEEYRHHVRDVWRATGILTTVTVVEVGIALLYYFFMEESGLRMGLNVLMVLATLMKAFYIVAVFMHMKYEKKALAMTVLMPLLFLIWFIIAFLWEGGYWFEVRTLY
jgi:cytochrome c oxidase subunit IV